MRFRFTYSDKFNDDETITANHPNAFFEKGKCYIEIKDLSELCNLCSFGLQGEILLGFDGALNEPYISVLNGALTESTVEWSKKVAYANAVVEDADAIRSVPTDIRADVMDIANDIKQNNDYQSRRPLSDSEVGAMVKEVL